MAPVVLELCLWIATYYGSTPARALSLALPPRVRAPSDTWVSATGSPAGTARRLRCWSCSRTARCPSPSWSSGQAPRPPRLRRLAKEGLVALEARLRVPHVIAGRTPPPEALTDAQTSAVARIETLIEAGGGDLLLHGVTGSGKTEVYLRAAESALGRDRSVLVLVPEIALSPQTARRFAARFGDQVAVLHSGLSDGERRAVREAVVAGRVRVVVGARSAVFSPLPRRRPDRRGRGARVRLQAGRRSPLRRPPRRRQAGAPRGRRAVLGIGHARARRAGSACRAQRCRPRRRPTCRAVEVVDLRHDGALSALAPAAHGARCDWRTRAAAPILLLNRRGEAPALHCRSCGEGFRCERLRRQPRAARGRAAALPSLRLHAACAERVPGLRLRRARAPGCGHRTRERGRERVAPARPGAAARRRRRRAARLARRHAGALRRRAAAVLVGTQLVAKGHDFRDLRLAAAIDADVRASPSPTSGPRSGRSRCSPSWPGAAAARRSAAACSQSWDPDQRVVRLAAEHAVDGVPGRRARATRAPRLPAVQAPRAGRGGGGGAAAPRWRRSSRCAPPPSPRSRATMCSGRRRSSGFGAGSARS